MSPRDSPAASPEWRISPISGPVGQTNPQRYRFGFGRTGGRERARIRHKHATSPRINCGASVRLSPPKIAGGLDGRMSGLSPLAPRDPANALGRSRKIRSGELSLRASPDWPRVVPPEPSKKERMRVRPAVLPCARASLARAPRARPSAPLAAVPTAPARGILSQTLGLAAPTWRP